MKFLVFYSLIFFALPLSAQTGLSQQVMGSLGESTSHGNIAVSYTLGECIISTEKGTRYALTQGFHQPGTIGEISFEIETTPASCPTSTDGGARIINLAGCRPPYSISWSIGESGTSVNRLSPGLYAVTVRTQFCTISTEFEIEAGPDTECKLVFFKAFSPNGDGKNDNWEIENISRPEFQDNQIEIFNRWGQTIWEGKKYNNRDVVWNGKTMSGNDLPDGTYFYVANVSGVVYKGFVEITR